MQTQLFGAPLVAQTTDEWYTPPWIFNAAGVTFDMDVCAPQDPICRTVPARTHLTVADDGLTTPWHGLVWMNPPYSTAGPWVDKWAAHLNGIALLPAMPEVRWLGTALNAADALTILAVYFIRPDGSTVRLKWSMLCLGRGTGAALIPRIAAADGYAAGAYHTMPLAHTPDTKAH